MSLITYSPQDVIINIRLGDKTVPMVAFDDGDFLSMEPNEDRTDEQHGADGTLLVTKNANISGTVTLGLMQNSPTNLDLADFQESLDYGNLNVQDVDITVSDPSGSVQAVAINCHIKRIPNFTTGSDATNREWVLYAEALIPSSRNIKDWKPTLLKRGFSEARLEVIFNALVNF